MSEHITVKELRKLISDLPTDIDNQYVWLGVDAGEGYIPLARVFSANPEKLPLDGDEIHYERLYTKVSDVKKNPPNGKYRVYTCDGDDINDSWKSLPGNTEVMVAMDIFVLGDWEANGFYEEIIAQEKANMTPEYLKLEEHVKDLEMQAFRQREAAHKTDNEIKKVRESMEKIVRKNLPKK